MKLKCGALSLDDEVVRIRAVREAIGPDVLFMLDMNAPYDVAGCILFAQAVAPYDIFWLEEPLHWYLQPADFQRLAAASPIPLAHGEREWHRYTVRDFIDSGAIRYVQFDSTRHAGFTESLRIAHYAEQKGVLIAPHSVGHLHGASRLGVRRRRVRRGIAWRCGAASAAPCDLSRRRRGQGWHGAPVGGAGLRAGNRLACGGEISRVIAGGTPHFGAPCHCEERSDAAISVQ